MPRSISRSIKKVPTSQNVSDSEPASPGRSSLRCRSINRVVPPAEGSSTNDQMACCGLSGGFPYRTSARPDLHLAYLPKLTGEAAEVPFWGHPNPISRLRRLQAGIDSIEIVDVGTEQPHYGGVGVEAAGRAPDLDEPGHTSSGGTAIEIAYVVRLPCSNDSSPGRSRTVSAPVAPQRLVIGINHKDAQASPPTARPAAAVEPSPQGTHLD
jgi:hypothetical protein